MQTNLNKKAYHPLVIAIDGPAASGKGTVGRRLADYFGYRYLDTGSLYRVVGLKLIYQEKSPDNEEQALQICKEITSDDLANPRIRQQKVGQAASIVSAIPSVRKSLLKWQQQFAANGQGAVLDGRDIGTVVCPDADFKVYMTATIDARARRRHKEYCGQGIDVSYESVYKELQARDERDSKRKIAPLKPAEDAFYLDTSYISANEVFDKLIGMIIPKAIVK